MRCVFSLHEKIYAYGGIYLYVLSIRSYVPDMRKCSSIDKPNIIYTKRSEYLKASSVSIQGSYIMDKIAYTKKTSIYRIGHVSVLELVSTGVFRAFIDMKAEKVQLYHVICQKC